MYNKLEQLEFKLEKNIGIQEHAGKVRKKGVNNQYCGTPFVDQFT